MKISESPYGMTETYTVKFWYTGTDGYTKQTSEDFYCNSKAAHKQVESFAKKYLGKSYQNIEIITITYN